MIYLRKVKIKMLSNIWYAIKAPFVWLNNLRHKLNDWVYRQMPGWKTHITAAIAFLGNTAFVLKDYVSQIPVEFLQKYITSDTLVVFNLILLSLIFWFRSLGNRDAV